MKLEDIARLHTEFARPEFGTTTPEELDYIQSLVIKHRPRKVIEIGTASGLTTGFIARFLSENDGVSITSIDLADQFFAARDKPVGYLADRVYSGTDIAISIHPRRLSLDLDDLDGPWDMAFIDANHQHPWPTLDTLAVAPHLTGPRIVIHHDLQLYRRHRDMGGIGPRVLFNEMPQRHRHAVKANGWNIFSLDLTLPNGSLEHAAIGALSIPWTARPPMGPRTLEKCSRFLSSHYSPELAAEFKDCAAQNRVSFASRAVQYLRAALGT